MKYQIGHLEYSNRLEGNDVCDKGKKATHEKLNRIQDG